MEGLNKGISLTPLGVLSRQADLTDISHAVNNCVKVNRFGIFLIRESKASRTRFKNGDVSYSIALS